MIEFLDYAREINAARRREKQRVERAAATLVFIVFLLGVGVGAVISHLIP